jgi:hypothetical protein
LFGKSKLPFPDGPEAVSTPLIPRSSYDPELPQLDITAPDHDITVEVDRGRGVLYVHVGPITVLRICRIKQITVTE